MRTLHELYSILWNEIKDRHLIDGICCEIDRLLGYEEITNYEWIALRKHFKSQKPSEIRHTDFTKHPSWIGGRLWWDRKETSERKRFIKLMMEITKPSYKPFLITREQQKALIDNYNKRAANNSELIGFIDGIEAVMDLISKL